MEIQKSYEALIVERLDELKAAAATGTTYGDWFSLRDDIEEELEWIRKQIRASENERRRDRRSLVRVEACRRGGSDAGWGGLVERRRRWLAETERRLAFERAIRDELKDALREWHRQEREDRKEREELSRWLEAYRRGEV